MSLFQLPFHILLNQKTHTSSSLLFMGAVAAPLFDTQYEHRDTGDDVDTIFNNWYLLVKVFYLVNNITIKTF